MFNNTIDVDLWPLLLAPIASIFLIRFYFPKHNQFPRDFLPSRLAEIQTRTKARSSKLESSQQQELKFSRESWERKREQRKEKKNALFPFPEKVNLIYIRRENWRECVVLAFPSPEGKYSGEKMTKSKIKLAKIEFLMKWMKDGKRWRVVSLSFPQDSVGYYRGFGSVICSICGEARERERADWERFVITQLVLFRI